MDRKELNRKLEELNEMLKNLNNSKHNYPDELEMYTRDLFDSIIDEIKN
jgi:TRAP-type C4-dicarboxylate transport system substrate-binding protein